jgi:uncharacterized membrane protein YjjP (DUF1212 family)
MIEKTADQLVEAVEDIKAILLVMKDKELDCCIQMNQGPRMALVRILELDDTQFKFQAITQTSSMVRKAKYQDIKIIEVYGLDSNIVHKKPNISRWMMLETVTFLEDSSSNDS